MSDDISWTAIVGAVTSIVAAIVALIGCACKWCRPTVDRTYRCCGWCCGGCREPFEDIFDIEVTKTKGNEDEQSATLLQPQDQGKPAGTTTADVHLVSERSRLDEDMIIKDYLRTRQKEKYRNENRMTPAIWHRHHKVDIAKVFTELNLLQSKKDEKEAPDKSTCIKKEGRPTSLTEVLDVMKSTDSCKVLITGKGGMGKTTLLKYIAHQWATDDEHVFADKLLFLINIRDIKASEKFLNIIMKNIDSQEVISKNNLPCDSVERFLVTHDNEIVILLDGYDELERDAKDPIDLFERSELRKSTVVITSRPDNITDLVECCDIHIDVKGFSPSNIKRYIHNHYNSVGETTCGESLIKEFKLDSEHTSEWGGDHKDAFELCSSPLLLLHICTIWKQKRVLPTDLSDLFKDLICCILNQYLNRAGNKSAIATFNKIPDQYKSALLVLGECMYEGLKKNKLSIDKYVLSKMAEKENINVNLALEFGFVYEDTPVDPGDVREMYTPPHKFMSEALAGMYLFTEIQTEGLNIDEYEVIRSNDYLNMTTVFTVGFLGADAGKLLKHWLMIRASNFYSIARCFRYIKEDNEEPVMQELDKDMPTEMKSYCEQMCETFRSVLDESKSGHFFKLVERCCLEYQLNVPGTLEEKVISLIDTSSEVSFRKSCRGVVLISGLVQELMGDQLLNTFQPNFFIPFTLFKNISNWNSEDLYILSAEMKYLQFNYTGTKVSLGFECNSSFLIHLLTHANNLSVLEVPSVVLTEAILSEVINQLHKTHIKLKLTKLDVSYTDLHNMDGAVLGKLFVKAPELNDLNASHCRLSGNTVRAMITECQNRGVKLEGCNVNISYNDIDDALLCDILKVYPNICLNVASCGLSKETFNNMVSKFNVIGLCKIDFSQNFLVSLDGEMFGTLLKKLPNLLYFGMCGCALSGSIVNVMMAECCKLNVVLKNNMLRLEGNDLSDINGKSLAELVRVMYKPHGSFRWSDYSLTVDNLEKLIESVGVDTRLIWKKINLCGINLSSFSGRTLACLVKISPCLYHINLNLCSLSGSIINEMMEECGRMNVILKDNMLGLVGNDLSDIDGKSLADLVRVIDEDDGDKPFTWSDYSLTADNLEKLVNSVGVNETLNWQRIDLSKINLSSISGKTLACLFKISPDLIDINMGHCSLSGSIVNEMIEECCSMKVALKDNILRLKGNDLSDIDGKSLSDLFRIVNKHYITYGDYSVTVDNLQKLIESEGVIMTFESLWN